MTTLQSITAVSLWMIVGAAPALSAPDQAADDLEEAVGLTDSNAADPEPRETPNKAVRWRAYGLIDWRAQQRRGHDAPKTNGPNGEIGGTFDASLPKHFAAFFDGRVLCDQELKRTYGVLDQGGARFRPDERISLALGKERNRRAPGLIVSPSDFIHSNQSVPGMREDRSGVWLARISWQTEGQSVDLLALPVSSQQETGLPSRDSRYDGTVARFFQRIPSGIDVGLDLGSIDESTKAGAFVQTIAKQVWKIYAEGGFNERTKSSTHLFGIGYEGSSTYTVRGEWYARGRESALPSPLFTDHSYAIFSASALEISDRFNLTETWLRSMETNRSVNLARAEWLVSSNHVAGITMVHLQPQEPFRSQATADWKMTF